MQKIQPYKVNYLCLCCGNGQLFTALDLNDQPLANSYLKSKNEQEYRYPLKLRYCKLCTHLQLEIAVDPDLLFKNYLYVSGTSNTLKHYFKTFVDIVQEYTDGKKVLDIACNDGTQLDAFKERGYDTHGIDPAENLYELSSKNHNVICNYFNESAIEGLDKNFDIITAQNVFAHVSTPLKFLEDCKKLLAPNGFIFIQTSQANMVENNEFDTIYHEHISFFSVRSFCRLAERAGLNVIDVRKTPVHGTSFLFVLSSGGEDRSLEFVKKEKKIDSVVLEKYAANVNKIKFKLDAKIKTYRALGYAIVGYGAAAKGNTLINFVHIDMDYIVDDNPLKQGLFTPGKKIPIKPPEFIGLETRKILLVPLAWNFFDEIKEKVKTIKDEGVKYLKYFPEVEIFDA